jgi:hypothetical protein
MLLTGLSEYAGSATPLIFQTFKNIVKKKALPIKKTWGYKVFQLIKLFSSCEQPHTLQINPIKV